jgi:recombination protein RecT
MTQEVTKSNQSQLTLSGMMEQYKGEIARALPKHVGVDRMARIAMSCARKNPRLLECTPESFLGAVIQSAQLGLEPGTPLGHAALIPRRNNKTGKMEVDFQPMYRGLMDLVYRAANHPIMDVTAVYEGDHFKYTKGLNPVLEHEPMPRQGHEKLTHVYCVAVFSDGRKIFRVMTRVEIERCKNRGKTDDIWKSDYEAMALKTVIRQTVKYLPMSAELQLAVGLDELSEAGVSQQNEMLLQGERPIHTKTERVDAKMGGEFEDFKGDKI